MARSQRFNKIIEVEVEDRDSKPITTIAGGKININVQKQVSTEPNVAYVEIYNLKKEQRENFHFKFDIFQQKFGNFVRIKAGYEGNVKTIFYGSIVEAYSFQDGTEIITRIELRTIIYEVLGKRYSKQVTTGYSKGKVILDILKENNIKLFTGQEKKVLELVTGTYKKKKTLTGTIQSVIDEVNSNIRNQITMHFDDAGITFLPAGVPLDIDEVVFDEYNGLIGSPKITPRGADFEVSLTPELRINHPIRIISRATSSYNKVFTGNFAVDGNSFVVSRVVHQGSNWEDNNFKSSVNALYPINTGTVATAQLDNAAIA